MLLKIYVVLWMLFAVALGAVAIAGNLTNLVATVFGFISMPLIFAGMIIIVPGICMHANEDQESNQTLLKTKAMQFTEKAKGDWKIADMAVSKFNSGLQL